MHIRSIDLLTAGGCSVLLTVGLIAALGQPLNVQQPGGAAGPDSNASNVSNASIPPEVQARLDKLQSESGRAAAVRDAGKEAGTLNEMGDLFMQISESQKTLDAYNRALIAARRAKDANQEAAALNGIAGCYRRQSLNDKALEEYKQALDLAIASGDLRGQATALNGLGWVNANMDRFQKAMELHNQALSLAQQVGDPDLEAQIVNRIGVVHDILAENQKALDSYNRALALWRAASDRDGEAKALNNIGIVYAELGEMPKALDYYNQAVPLYHQAGDRSGEAGALINIGVLLRRIGEEQKALDSFRQALPFERALGNRFGEAAALNSLGNVYSDLGENREALQFFSESLAIRQSLTDPLGQAGVLHNIGEQWVRLGEMQKALEALQQALALWTTANERRGKANTLNALGIVYDDLGDPQQALGYYVRALAIDKDVDDRDGEATVLNNIAGVFNAPDQKRRALEYYGLALDLERAVHNRDGEARTLNNMALVYEDLGEKQKALDCLDQALPIWREVGNRSGESQALDNLGSFSDSAGEKEKARAYYAQALPLARAVSDPVHEARIFHNLMLNQKAAQPALAIFYGKQAVNLLQQVRGEMQGLDQALQRSFLTSKNEYYHDLAGLLIAQGRLPEAQQVLDLLKEQEYSDYVRGETEKTLNPLTLTPTEQRAKDDYEKSTAQIVAAGEQWMQLKRNSARTAEEEKTFQQLSDELDAAGKALDDYYARLYVAFGTNGEANRQVADVKGNVSLLQQAIAKMPHTVALYTLVGKDHYSVIVITGSAAVAREYAIADVDLNKKIAEFQQVLRDPARDAKPLAAELYTILMGPVAADLEQAKAETLVWSLDGVLRYLPMAALYDGSKYVVEKYNTVTITPVSIPHLLEKPDVGNLNVAAMGISREYEAGLSALPAVAGELNEVAKDTQSQESHGALPGTILLNGEFTEKAMENLLERQFPVVHIASHFVFKPGDDGQSYLLLAGKDKDTAGYHLTVADFRDNPRLSLGDADLLTLSACETGLSGNASNGREVDGLGTTAQLKGAKAVISSLWEVNDASTGELMADFYKRWAEGQGKVGKADALREAQLDLLLGKLTPQSGGSSRGIIVEDGGKKGPARFAHPYYWAPFVLMGNWR